MTTRNFIEEARGLILYFGALFLAVAVSLSIVCNPWFSFLAIPGIICCIYGEIDQRIDLSQSSFFVLLRLFYF
jgi:hypothetical protein